MASLDWSNAAALAYGRVSEGGGRLHDRLDHVLDLLESDAMPATVTSLRDKSGRLLQGTLIRNYTDEILLLWQRISADIIYIVYLGPNIGTDQR